MFTISQCYKDHWDTGVGHINSLELDAGFIIVDNYATKIAVGLDVCNFLVKTAVSSFDENYLMLSWRIYGNL